jgi:hypothetical protein
VTPYSKALYRLYMPVLVTDNMYKQSDLPLKPVLQCVEDDAGLIGIDNLVHGQSHAHQGSRDGHTPLAAELWDFHKLVRRSVVAMQPMSNSLPQRSEAK